MILVTFFSLVHIINMLLKYIMYLMILIHQIIQLILVNPNVALFKKELHIFH